MYIAMCWSLNNSLTHTKISENVSVIYVQSILEFDQSICLFYMWKGVIMWYKFTPQTSLCTALSLNKYKQEPHSQNTLYSQHKC